MFNWLTNGIDWDTTKEESALITAIADRAYRLYSVRGINDSFMTLAMDITACHKNACSLDLQKLLHASDEDFSHDILGIRQNLNRRTAKLKNDFRPHCAHQGYTLVSYLVPVTVLGGQAIAAFNHPLCL